MTRNRYKTAAAAGIVTAVTIAFAPVANAQEKAKDESKPKNAITIYGIADVGVEIGDYGQGTKTRLQSGLGSASRLGFKGERALPNDLTAFFQLEMGISIDNGQNTGHSSNVSNPGTSSSNAPNTTGQAIFSRNTFAGLRGGFGDLRIGRDYAPIYSLAAPSDPFTIGGATAFRLWSSAAAGRFDNGIFYSTPSFGGAKAAFAYTAGMENNTDSNQIGASGATDSLGPKDEGKGWSANLTFKQDAVFVGAGYLEFKRTGGVTAPATENKTRKSWNVAASYDFGAAKVYGHFLSGEDTQDGVAGKSLDRQVGWVGVSVPLNAHTLRAVYARLNDQTAANQDSSHVGLGYEYALDGKTDLYTYYARVTNQNGGQNSLCAGGTCQGFDKDSNLPVNFTPKALMAGMRYRF